MFVQTQSIYDQSAFFEKMGFSTGEKIGGAVMILFVFVVVILSGVILIGTDEIAVWGQAIVDLVFEVANQIREALFPTEQ